jgi:hypothetical protein
MVGGEVMWVYTQSTGVLLFPDGKKTTTGYSGHGAGKNNPAMQDVVMVGPIPVGSYTIGRRFDSELRGPVCLQLIPFPKNEMFGRSGFLVHGDSRAHEGGASEGCIVIDRPTRVAMSSSTDNTLQVVA